MSEVNMAKAQETFEILCSMLDNRGWHYEKKEQELIVKAGVKGEDFPIEFIMSVEPKSEIVTFMSLLPFNAGEDKRIDMALAVCVANYGLKDGSFDYKIDDGSIIFRLTSSYRGSTLSEDLFEYMIMVSAATIDEYNDKFFMISKGVMSIQQFIESE